MEKNIFIKSTIILIIGGLITKLLGMFIKIVTTRYVGLDGIALYMLILPTFSLFINLTQLGFPVAISKLVAEETKNNKNIIFSIIPVSMIFNIILLIIILLLSPVISNLLHDHRTIYPLISIGFVLPFISISCIIRGYFFGKQKMFAHIVSHISEQIVRLLLIIIVTPILLKESLELAVTGIVLVNIISELTSTVILIFFLPRKIKITREDMKPNREVIKDVLSIGIPTTGSRLIGSIGYFFEPIIITFMAIQVGYTSGFIINEYGILNGYVLPLLMLPSFFTQAISSALIPVISKSYYNKRFTYVKNKLKQAIIFSVSIGLITTILFMIYPTFFLNLVYDTNEGLEYLKVLAPFFLIYYIQVPLTATLQSINRAKEAMNSTLIGMIIKITLIFILFPFKMGLYALIIASIVNIFIVTILNYKHIKKVLNDKIKQTS
jgi:stage V sporulation protein B